MAFDKFDWNVVVVGYWNPAILTPRGIGRRLFDLEEGTPIMVEVPMDGLAPHRVRHEGMIVTAEGGRLTIMTENQSLDDLQRARKIAAACIRSLPETPLTAAGFNLRFKVDDPPVNLLQNTQVELDNELSDAQFEIMQRTLRRSMKYKQGHLNLETTQAGDAETKVEFNFHLQSSDAGKLQEWLSMSNEDIQRDIARILNIWGIHERNL